MIGLPADSRILLKGKVQFVIKHANFGFVFNRVAAERAAKIQEVVVFQIND